MNTSYVEFYEKNKLIKVYFKLIFPTYTKSYHKIINIVK